MLIHNQCLYVYRIFINCFHTKYQERSSSWLFSNHCYESENQINISQVRHFITLSIKNISYGATTLMGYGIHIIEVSRSYSDTTLHSIGLLFTSDKPDAETST
jgi:hypothetical protein